MGYIQVQMIDNLISSDWWRKLIQHYIKIGDELEIRCWQEEAAEIQQASWYGKSEDDKYEVSIRGTVTAKLLAELLTEEPADKSVYNKMTKYFTINVKNELCDFSSAHYGTEVYINRASKNDVAFVSAVMRPYGSCFSISMDIHDFE